MISHLCNDVIYYNFENCLDNYQAGDFALRNCFIVDKHKRLNQVIAFLICGNIVQTPMPFRTIVDVHDHATLRYEDRTDGSYELST